eukprot:CAMPEP_0173341636 /NCGR_PEP_ID=MMETSP1144-20121109/9689_1 /TAXON_ID=483371 /ORGANISM="non described non described, Strain CCMP2298" /LENGTH=357 /DNA_ID=CAMNT_0014287995 /DNA_START=24 /DNA_END=1093 /DNA_ORIENTATION=-
MWRRIGHTARTLRVSRQSRQARHCTDSTLTRGSVPVPSVASASVPGSVTTTRTKNSQNRAPATPAPTETAPGTAQAGAQGRETEGAEAATEGGSIFDQERDMFNIRRKMAACYQLGSYQSALQHAQELRDRAAGLMGRRNAVYASSLNNVALMHKMLGEKEAAMDSYTEALQVYLEVAGKAHPSYASTLSNLGVLYKDMARDSKGMDKHELLARAEEALGDALSTRTSLGPTSKDTLYSAMHMASLLRMTKQEQKALVLLQETLLKAQQTYGLIDLICAALHNDLGLLLKSRGSTDSASESTYSEALVHYTTALEIRSKQLGDLHSDTVVSTHNLAELYVAMGQEEKAAVLWEQLRG